MEIGSKFVDGENLIDKKTGAVNVPIYQSSTFHQFDINNFGEYDYSRSGNPTRDGVESVLARIESGKYGYAFSSGMAAICSVLSIFESGDHIVVAADVYGGTYRAVTEFFSRYNIEFTFVDTSDIQAIRSAVKENTKALYLETPSNPLLKVTDLNACVEIAKDKNIITIVDNTFMSPYLQRPLELGIDIVVHSATKFLGGHSDIIAGVAVTNDIDIAKRIKVVQNSFGAILGPQDCFLLLRGIKTLKVRMEESQKNAIKLASWLSDNEYVEKVYYPGLEESDGYKINRKQADGPGAVLSFEFKTLEKTEEFLNNVKGVVVAVSLGGVETIVSYPARMSHAAIPKEEREKLGIKDTLVRVSLGLEDIEDLINNFNKAINN
ncbi:PLP-dependent aspartate aminotransferase family protein [uncultured Clostridium sp.]|jgi:cystathionine beta-lyase|uniref:trans-sulfuration enzyme family protein n=1 Tax=uncultured Clostridium sp. TaxID=59620 RepID=UPI00260310E5|nr:PLP-dependent aspartate aminotransferase family protein [uncultured Clostridium sp.]